MTLAGRFAAVKHNFTALEAGTSNTRTLFGTWRWTVSIYEDVEQDIARTISAVSSGPLDDFIPLKTLIEPARINFYESKDGIQSYMATSFSSIKDARNERQASNRKRILARTAPPSWVKESQEIVRKRGRPTRCAIFSGSGLPLTLGFPYRVGKAQGSFFV